MSVFAIVDCITCFILLFSSRDLERFVRTRAPVDDDVSCMISVLLVFSSVGRCPAFGKSNCTFCIEKQGGSTVVDESKASLDVQNWGGAALSHAGRARLLIVPRVREC